MNTTEIKLETKLVGDIQGEFFIPSYQRGYRWGKEEVTRLLEDIYTNGNKSYCLQPVVVRKNGDKFELIDGQQRLTTLFILLQYIKREYKPRIALKYGLSYETRPNSAGYLSDIKEELSGSNIDFYHIFRAYKAIDDWFNSQPDSVVAADDVYGYLVKYVRIIWYEVGEDEDAISLFTRLNIGKIPLTSAELVKAMFLSKSYGNDIDKEKQEEISLQWDNMEKELHNDALWYFLTNKTSTRYQTRIDLVLDLISKKPENSREKYYTFFEFDKKHQSESLDEIWHNIQQKFLLLKDWFEDHELYHKIGYLIASGKKTLKEISYESEGKTKDDFRASLDYFIRESIVLNGKSNEDKVTYADLTYERPQDQERITTLLLLFNVESVRRNGENTQWFPFDKFKFDKGGKVTWSLEHIHAQHSEGLKTQEMWKEWLRLHIPSVKAVGDGNAELAAQMQAAIDDRSLVRQKFDRLQQQVVALLSVEGNTEYLHSISNMALLSAGDNAALNNSTFDVKRNIIIEMDKNGQYIPFCTKMVFLKYYTPSAENQLHFWGQADRIAYVKAMNDVLKDYLPEPIKFNEEDN